MNTYNMAGQEGFEPPTHRFGVWRSTVRATALLQAIKTTGFLKAFGPAPSRSQDGLYEHTFIQ